jgi:signal peptidase I
MKKNKIEKLFLGLFGSTFFLLSFKCKDSTKLVALPTIEMRNTYQKGDWFLLDNSSQINRNDLVAFKRKGMLYDYPVNDTDYLRVVGIPGDSIMICKGVVWINNRPLNNLAKQKRPYIISIKDLNVIKSPADYYAGENFVKQYDGNVFPGDYAMVSLDSMELIKMRESREAIPLEDFNTALCTDTIGAYAIGKVKMMFDTCPPLYIPRKGDQISIPAYCLKYYSNGGTQFKLSKDNKYILESNMYFLLGDNWTVSFDSRQFGMVKSEDILGVMVFKKSKDSNDKNIKERPNYFSMW